MIEAMRKWGWMVAVAVAAVAAFAAIAQAAIPAADGTITACYKNNNGDLHVVDSASQCKNNETPLTWNQTGPAGPEGPEGAEGPAGISGYEVINYIENGALPTGGDVTRQADCSPGKKVLGGGYVVPMVLDNVPMSRPNPEHNAWVVSFHSNGGSGAVSVYAVCAFVD